MLGMNKSKNWHFETKSALGVAIALYLIGSLATFSSQFRGFLAFVPFLLASIVALVGLLIEFSIREF